MCKKKSILPAKQPRKVRSPLAESLKTPMLGKCRKKSGISSPKKCSYGIMVGNWGGGQTFNEGMQMVVEGSKQVSGSSLFLPKYYMIC